MVATPACSALLTLVTVPLPVLVPGNACPSAKLIWPLLARLSPVSAAAVPSQTARFSRGRGHVIAEKPDLNPGSGLRSGLVRRRYRRVCV